MSSRNRLAQRPPHAVEVSLQRLGADLRTARTRRGLTRAQAAEKIGTGIRAVADAERGKATTAAAVYLALLWAYDLLGQLDGVASPASDAEGLALAVAREPGRVRHPRELDNDF